MNLLIVTQKVDKNDDILGFFHRWILEFAKHCEKLTVICLYEGEHDLPTNVKVLSLGKEKGESRLKYLLNFYKYILSERGNYSSVFVHMNPLYVILGGVFWNLMNKKLALWYTHKNVDLKLRLAETLVDYIFTASAESFRLSSRKIHVMGHGIDIEQFSSVKRENDGVFTILTASRISKVKNINELIEAAEVLKNKAFKFKMIIAGAPATREDEIYFQKLQESLDEKKLGSYIEFVGSVSHKEMAKFYSRGDLFVNLSDTGSLDKAVLEAMASGLNILTSNEAFRMILPSENIIDKDPELISDSVFKFEKSRLSFRACVERDHRLHNLIDNIVAFYE